MKTKIRVLVEIHNKTLFAYSPDIPNVSRFGCDWNNVIENFTKAFQEQVNEVAYPKGYQLYFSLDVGKFTKDYPVFNLVELANYLGINASLLHQYKDKVKSPSEERSLLILKGLEKIGKSLSKLNTRI